jgi:hypothetical protein
LTLINDWSASGGSSDDVVGSTTLTLVNNWSAGGGNNSNDVIGSTTLTLVHDWSASGSCSNDVVGSTTLTLVNNWSAGGGNDSNDVISSTTLTLIHDWNGWRGARSRARHWNSGSDFDGFTSFRSFPLTSYVANGAARFKPSFGGVSVADTKASEGDEEAGGCGGFHGFDGCGGR